MAGTTFEIRISLRDADTVKRALQQMGDEGAAALKRFEQATQPASAGLQSLDAAAQGVQGTLEGLASGAGRIGEALARLGPVGLAAGAAVGTMAAAFAAATAGAQKSIEVFGKLTDQADQLGLSAEDLQSLQFGFRTVGVEGDKLSVAFGKLNEAVGHIMEKGMDAPPALVETLHKMGISVGEVQKFGDDTMGVLRLLFDGFEQLGTHAEKAAAAQELFGRSGRLLIPILEQGQAGLDKITEAARTQGAVLENQSVAAWDDFGDRITNAKQIMEAAAARTFVEFGEGLANAAEAAAKVAKAIADASDKIRELASDAGAALQALKDFGAGAVNAISTITAPLNALVALLDKIPGTGALGKLPTVGEGGATVGGVVSGLTAPLDKLTEFINQLNPLSNALGTVPQIGGTFAAIGTKIKQTKQDLDKAQSGLLFNLGDFGTIGVSQAQPRPGLPRPVSSGRKGERERAAPKEPKLDFEQGTIPMQDWLVTAEQAFSKFDQISQESLTKTQNGATDLMQRLLQANLQSHGSMIDLINMRRDEDMKAINIAALNDEQKAKARALANDTASRAIIQARQREINVMDGIVQANQQATGQLVAGIELRRDRALAALEDELSSEEDKAKARVLINETAQRQIEGDRTTIGARQQELIQGTGYGAQASPWEQAGATMDAFGRKLTDINGMANGLMQGLASVGATASSAFADAVMAGDSFSDTLDKLSLSIEKMMIQLTLQMALQAAIGGAMGGIGGLLMGGGAGAGAGGYGATGGGMGMMSGGTNPGFLLGGVRKGGVFSSGQMIPFAHGGMIERSPTAFPAIWSGIPRHLWPMARGGIVSQPTVFPMARGWGLMGEAGHEAVMPLQKTPSGELRVYAVSADPMRRMNHDGLALTRTPRGDLAVKLPLSERFQYGGIVSGSNGLVEFASGGVVGSSRGPVMLSGDDKKQPLVNVNIINNAAAKVTTQEQRDQNGNLNINVLVDAIESAMAQRVQRPGGTLNKALLPALNPIKAR